MSFSDKIRENALVASGRHCCICHKFCGLKIELHHIRPKSGDGDDTFENCIALCFDCHSDMSSYDHRHPKGTKYSEAELRQHRDTWYAKVQNCIGILNLPEHLELDRRTYLRLKALVPWEGSIQFIRYNNFTGFSFERESLNDFRKLQWECDNPSFEFIDADLEGLRANLIATVGTFLYIIGHETFPVQGSNNLNTVPMEWEFEQPDRFFKVVERLHGLTDQITEYYDALTHLARRKLGVD